MDSTTASKTINTKSIAYASSVFVFVLIILFQRALSLPTISLALVIAAVAGIKSVLVKRPRAVLKPDQYLGLELSHKFPISSNTAIYRFKLPRPNDILGIPIGQHVSLAAQIDQQAKEVIRSYTPITDDTTTGHVDLIIKSYPNGNLSRYMTTLELGQCIKFRGPKGAFRYTPNMVREIGMIAGGTGITPMLQIVRAIARGRASGDRTIVNLIYANETLPDILLKEELDQIASSDNNFHVHYVLNKPPANWNGNIGFVSCDLIKRLLPAPASDVKILLCGPPPMIRAMKGHTESLGFDKALAVSKLENQVFCF